MKADIYRDRFKPNAGVVKSKEYGHCASETARILLGSGIGYLAVSDLQEGLGLRKECSKFSVLAMGEIRERHIAEAHETTARVHVKVDTGMGRFGMAPETVLPTLKTLKGIPFVHSEGILSHLSTTFFDDQESDAFTLRQLGIFDGFCRHPKSGASAFRPPKQPPQYPADDVRHLRCGRGFRVPNRVALEKRCGRRHRRDRTESDDRRCLVAAIG